jgi:gliding motility-associated-like protein
VPNNRFDQAINKVLIQQSGRFTLFQKLYGPSGCITQDSVKLAITPGITAGYKPQLKRSTVINNTTTLTEWKPVPYAKSYQVYRNGQLHAVVKDTFFKDYLSAEIDQSHTYEIQAKDSCDNLSGLKSNIGKTIFLKVTEVEPASKSDFPTALLTWSPYEDWATNGGVKRHESFGTYDIETSNWQPLNNQKDTQFSDKDFVQPKKFQKCYIVKAQSSDLAYESQSNSFCLGYQATLFAPSAFTPNGDGLNDEFEIFNYGFDHFTLTIFNSWGQKIYEQEGSTAIWKPATDMPQGVYVYTIKASRKKKEYTFSSTVTLLK